MRFLNSMDIDALRDKHGARNTNLGHAVRILAALRDDVDAHSDGWPYWQTPRRAARRLIELIDCAAPTPFARTTEIHADALRKALIPIRAFYTRAHGGFYGGQFPATNRYLSE